MKNLISISILFAVSLPAYSSTTFDDDYRDAVEKFKDINAPHSDSKKNNTNLIEKNYVVDATRAVKHFWFVGDKSYYDVEGKYFRCKNITITTFYNIDTKKFSSIAGTGGCVKKIVEFDSDLAWQSQTIFDLNKFIQEKRRQSLEDFKKYIVQ